MDSIVIKIGGEAGFGIMAAGAMLGKLATRSGYDIFGYSEYPSIIRGGHNVVEIVVAKKRVRSPYWRTDVLVALNADTFNRHVAKLQPGSYVLYDSDQKINLAALPKGVIVVAVPIGYLAREFGGTVFIRNAAALGALTALVGGDINILKKIFDDEFGGKKNLVELDKKTVVAAYEYVQKKYPDKLISVLSPRRLRPDKIIMTGNEAIALGAVAAGMQFASIYPMTPTSGILHTLAALQQDYNFIYKQPEDEISALNMAIGASFAGVRAMTATAGGGFCLMAESYGLAAMTETPAVIVVGMRGGPATGLPTWTEQGDLQFVLHAHQSEFARIVLAPGDLEEAFFMTMQAFNLADKYQTPVILLVDKHLCESQKSNVPFDFTSYCVDRGKVIDCFKNDYARYELSKDGVSPRSFPGAGNHVLANSDEHNEHGYTSEESDNREKMMKKRLQKQVECEKKDMPLPKVYGKNKANLSIISWGSNKGVILDAMKQFTNVNFLHITWMSPFPAKAVRKFLEQANETVIFECNYTGQLQALIKEKTGIDIKHHVRKFDGRPFFVEEVVEKIKKFL